MTATEPTRVILRRWRAEPKTIIALMPDIDEGPGLIQCYERIGQHGAASPLIVSRTRPVDPTEEDAVSLIRELERIGYSVRLVKRMPNRSQS